jgi:RNA polymerase sigma-70 factor (ECF subfamily)
MVVSLPGYRSTGAPFQAWLYSIARNLVIDSYRKSSAQNPLPIEEAADISTDEAGPAQTVEDRIFIDQIQNALQELTPYRKDVLVLRFIVGLPLQEVASILGKTIGSIKVTQHRALNDIRAILGSNSGEER